MFTAGMRGLRGRGMGRLGEFVNEPRKLEYWLASVPSAPAPSIIPGVSNTTTAVAAGGLGLLAAAAAAYYFLKK